MVQVVYEPLHYCVVRGWPASALDTWEQRWGERRADGAEEGVHHPGESQPCVARDEIVVLLLSERHVLAGG